MNEDVSSPIKNGVFFHCHVSLLEINTNISYMMNVTYSTGQICNSPQAMEVEVKDCERQYGKHANLVKTALQMVNHS